MLKGGVDWRDRMSLRGCAYRFSTGAPPERLCAPLVEYIQQRGGEVRLNSRLREIELNADGSVAQYRLTDGSAVQGDLYVSAMPGQHDTPWLDLVEVWCSRGAGV